MEHIFVHAGGSHISNSWSWRGVGSGEARHHSCGLDSVYVTLIDGLRRKCDEECVSGIKALVGQQNNFFDGYFSLSLTLT